MGGDLKPGPSAFQVKAPFLKRHSCLLRKTTNVHTAGPFFSQGVLKQKTEPVPSQVATQRAPWVEVTLCTQLPSSRALGGSGGACLQPESL